MNRTIKDIQKDIEQLGIKGGYDIEQLLTPQDCRRLSYEIERLNNIINELEKWLEERIEKHTEDYLDWKYDRNVYLAVDEKLQDVFDKLQELKGSDNNE